ncbi:MAG: TRAP transporter substrate-binding protein [Paracoccaceae bacterium]
MFYKSMAGSAMAAALIVGAAGSAQAINLSFALHTSPPGPEFEAVDKFIELVEERSKGEITVKTYPSAVLGGERDNLEQLTVNEVQMTLFGDTLPNVVTPEYAATVVPFVFPGPEEVFEYWASPIGDKAKALIHEKVKIDMVALTRRGDRHLTAKKAVNSPDDIQGVKMRVPEIPSWVKVWSQIGASPTPVAWPEVFSAMQMGVVEAQENPCFNINQAKLYEVQTHVMLTAHVPAVWHWSISSDFLESLTPELREAVVSSAVDAAAYGDEVTKEQIDKTCAALADEHGMTLLEVDRGPFIKAARPAIDELAKDWAPGVREAVSKYLD